MKKIVFTLSVLICAVHTSLISAKNFGMIGSTYPIAETDFFQLIQTRMREKIQNGEFARWQTKQIQTIKSFADRPLPVVGLVPTQQTKSWLYNPTLTVMHTMLNPLDHVTWTKTLLFYDADDVAQVAWAKQMVQQLKNQVILILTQGSVSAQTQIQKQRVYFDQEGQLVQRFGITHVPASISQEGNQLRVTEVKL